MLVQEFFYKILFDKFDELKYLEFILRRDFINIYKNYILHILKSYQILTYF